MTTVPRSPVLRYPGSKWRLAPWIVSHFPAHARYVEPCCGSAAVFLHKERAPHEVLNDLDGEIVHLFRCIRERGEELARLVEMTPWAEEEYLLSCLESKGAQDPLERARVFLVRSWQAHGATTGGTSGWRHHGRDAGSTVHPVRLWKQLPTRILSVMERLRDAEIRQRPALEVIAYYNDRQTLLYVDPPYMPTTRRASLYRYEMSEADHEELLGALMAHRGPVVLSGYDHPLYEQWLSPDWQRIACASLAEHGARRTEVLWLNRQAHMPASLWENHPPQEERPA